MSADWIADFDGTTWSGKAELWLDPLGHDAEISDCTLAFADDVLTYTWAYQDELQTGVFTFNTPGANWKDSWHQPETVQCQDTPDTWGLFSVAYTYPAAPGPDWGWRMQLSQRPDGSMVLQMTNITPWGEEGRAVRMICQPAD